MIFIFTNKNEAADSNYCFLTIINIPPFLVDLPNDVDVKSKFRVFKMGVVYIKNSAVVSGSFREIPKLAK